MSLGRELVAYGGTLLAVVCAAFAFWRGGWAERTASVVVLSAWFLTPVIQTTFAPRLPLVLLDTTQAAALLTISLYSRRKWSALITACACAGVVTDIAGVFGPQTLTSAWAYVVTSQCLCGIFIALSLGLAVWECEYLRKQSDRGGTSRRRAT